MKRSIKIAISVTLPLVLLVLFNASTVLQWRMNFPLWLDTVNFILTVLTGLSFLVFWPYACYLIAKSSVKMLWKILSIVIIAIAFIALLAQLITAMAWS